MMNIFLRGILYGILSIIPGLSGGVVAYKFGDYDNCLLIINNKDFNFKNLLYLCVLLVSFILGSSFCSRIILDLFYSFTIEYVTSKRKLLVSISGPLTTSRDAVYPPPLMPRLRP